jgi:hypothetical protein
LRLIRKSSIILIFVLAFALSACSNSASVSSILLQKGISEKTAAKMKVEIRFLQESKGSNYKYADVSGDLAFVGQLLGLMQGCVKADLPDGQYTPEL